MYHQSSLSANFFRKTNIVVWGCGQNGKNLLQRFPELAERITEYVDSSFLKIGEQFLDKWVIKAPAFLDPHIHNVIVTPSVSGEIVEYLEAKGFVYTINCIFYSDLTEPEYSFVTNGIEKYKKAHPEIYLFTYCIPALPQQNPSQNEQYILDNRISYWAVRDNPHSSPSLAKYFSTLKEMLEAIVPPKSYYDAYGVRKFEDVHGKIVNTSNGHRITTDQPNKYKRTIFVVGRCSSFGTGASDKGTTSSHLQRLFNHFAPEYEIIVENYGYYLWNGDNKENLKSCFQGMIDVLNALPIRSGDIVLCQGFERPFDIDLSAAATHPHNYGDVFWDLGHCTEDGYHLVADKIFYYLKENDFFHNKDTGLTKKALSYNGSLQITDETMREKLKAYKNKLSKFKPRVGAIVMNCNPFTFGHRFLIEQAATQVTQLFIFVVQEDKSFFPFEDRLVLVREGVQDLSNVTVIPSGQFILSTLTFAEYFNKSELQNRTIDSSMDVNLFGQEIAPCLNIHIRFIGEEPIDMVTKQYNQTMKAILPRYRIEVVEIPRKDYDGEVISASRVRALLKEKKFNEIAKLVPRTTLDYLKEKFG